MILVVNNYSDNNIHLGDLQMKELGVQLQEISGMDFMVKRYYEVSARFLKENTQIRGIVLGGCNSNWDHLYFDIFDGEFELIREASVPILGICAGHQLMAMAYGGSARRCDFGKEERIFTYIDILAESPLTKGISGKIYAFEYHSCMVPEIPNGFERLMSSEKTYIQAMKKIGEHKYGVQFHPELDREAADPLFKADKQENVNGNIVLTNFLELLK
jgi:GMP synthase (glutamine-hydrolysing)